MPGVCRRTLDQFDRLEKQRVAAVNAVGMGPVTPEIALVVP